MKPELKYIELKSGFGDNGPAWIGIAEFSKSGRTVYFNGKALKNANAMGIEGGNHYDIETGEEYWVSGIKKNGTDRHWAGGGKIMIDRNVVDLYLSLVDFNVLDKNRFELIDVNPTDKQKFSELENEKLS
ncbi:mannose-1-phosphate guanylyltransferase [Aureibaculum conchae]|uniref:mannose-1-phosphate guanylyltransferase n=1 Tax=Aureibaculum sp. 2308TA14-22 TaxID=3108392 RepID=UPI00339A3AD6